MTNASHPDDERLAALAAADRDAVDDRELLEHLAGCTRCSDLVSDLTSLRSMLAELPDVAPSRPLQLLPPLPEPASRGRLPWLRRLVAPTIVAGAGLVLVGAIGTAGSLGSAARLNFLTAGEAAGASPGAPVPATQSQSADSADRNPPTARPTSLYGSLGSPVPAPTVSAPSPSHVPAAQGGSGNKSASRDAATAVPTMAWLAALVAGLGLILLGLILRFAVQPRAG